MKLRHIVLLVGLVLSGSAWADAKSFTGADVLKYCVSSKPNDVPKPGYDQDMTVMCWANFQASLETALILAGDRQICVPKNLNPMDVLMTTVKHLRTYPQEQKALASSVYVGVLQNYWPCRK